MTELLSNLWMGFHVAANPFNIFFCLLGALVGTLVGVLPGIGTVATIAMLLPITFGLPPVGALIMLAGIYYGAQYGGSTTSVLVNIPGEATSVITCLDGHQMARQGRAGPALSIAAIGSFFAGCVSTVLVAALGAPLTSLALLFGPAEYFSLMVLGLIFAVVLAKGSVLKAVAMVVMGLLLSMVGSDLETGAARMSFDIPELADGIGFANVAMGVFGFAEIIRNLELPGESRDIVQAKITGLMPTRKDLINSSGAIVRGTFLGSLLGILPGGGAVIASFAAYTFEKRNRERSLAFRPRRHRRRRRTREREQCGRADVLHTTAHVGDTAERGYGAHGRRHDYPWHRARSAGNDETAGAFLGHDCIHVARQPDAGSDQPAVGRGLGFSVTRAVPAALSVHHRFLLHRNLLHQQLSDGCGDLRDVRYRGLLADQA